MRIYCLTTFLDGRDRFEEGDTRTVDPDCGRRFVAAGWAREEFDLAAAADSEPTATSLNTHDSSVGTGDGNG
jgi:hypothetical protein